MPTLRLSETARAGALLGAWLVAALPHARGAEPSEPAVSASESRALSEAAELAERDPAAAAAKLRSVLRPESSAALDYSLGVLSIRLERYEEAEAALREAVRKSPGFARAWSQLGRLLLDRRDPTGAAEAFRRALGGEGEAAETWKLLGYAYLLEGRLLEAETAYRRALALGPGDRETLVGLARVYLAREAHRDALAVAEELVRLDPLRGEHWTLAANASIGLEKTEDAAVALECARRLGAAGGDALATLGDLYYNLRLFALAARRYEEAFEGEGVPPERILRSAEALFAAGEAGRAESLVEKLEGKALREGGKVWVLRGRIAEARLDSSGAIAAYERAAAEDPLDGEALLALGRLFWQAGLRERARTVLERASRVRGFEAKALVLLAQVAVEEDRYRDAVRDLEKALEVEPSAWIRRYLEEVEAAEAALGPRSRW